jgi:acetyl-CoA carboxylase carboxyl transferase subunit beta
MAWLNRDKAPLVSGERKDTPDGLWERCDNCTEIIFKRDFDANQRVCPKCQFHYPLPPEDRIDRFVDQDSFEELDAGLASVDPLKFGDKKPYNERLQAAARELHHNDAIICGRAKLMGIPIHLGVFDFRFMGGSMGTVVGEKIARLFTRAAETKQPAIIVTSSGGARMQEGVLSLMQMAKTCAALSNMRAAGAPFVSIMTHPTTGGVAASFAMLGDVNIGEPGALIGFAGPRVIQQTIKQELPKGFQRSEYLLEHGMLDMICHRDSLRVRCAQILGILMTQRQFLS